MSIRVRTVQRVIVANRVLQNHQLLVDFRQEQSIPEEQNYALEHALEKVFLGHPITISGDLRIILRRYIDCPEEMPEGTSIQKAMYCAAIFGGGKCVG